MHMNNSGLKSHKQDPISLLEIVSMEGRYYMARFYLDGQGYVLTDSNDKPVMFTGANAAHEHFRDYDVKKTEVIPPTGTDEMIGMPDSGEETMRVPL
ncbi:DUF6482 family protein [Marinobacter confluentis]|uniref:NADH-quinone reductase n=1 Tax=Marinobacter confluentis TaxID=1697557 RepID=A0A4Z1C0P9_9GAMM|nr:DUF6482 family protein [Marinobacter confluentis]TGN39463.1 hypothetical protein E5Q11_12630 [Marinobacter confluentis]